jgi:hypothetical protein
MAIAVTLVWTPCNDCVHAHADAAFEAQCQAQPAMGAALLEAALRVRCENSALVHPDNLDAWSEGEQQEQSELTWLAMRSVHVFSKQPAAQLVSEQYSLWLTCLKTAAACLHSTARCGCCWCASNRL